jgi:hypothetical protein
MSFSESLLKERFDLLHDKFPENERFELTENKVSNLLGSLRQEKKISKVGTTKKPKYALMNL